MTMRLDRLALLVAAVGIAIAPAGAADVQWNVASGNFSNPSNWSPFGIPDAVDDVTYGGLVPGATGAIDVDATVRDIDIVGGSNIIIFDPAVTVDTGSLFIEAGSSLLVTGFTEDIDVEAEDFFTLHGSLFLSGGSVRARTLNDVLAGTGLIEGHGRLIATFGSQFTGTIRPEGGTLRLVLLSFDLDGTTEQNTIIDAVAGGELIVTGVLTDPFSGTIDIAPGGRVEFVDADVDVFVQLTGSATERAELDIDRLTGGATVWASGGLCGFDGYLENGTMLDVNLTADVDARITNEIGSTVEVNGTLRFDDEGTSEMGGGTVFGTGTIRANPGSLVRVAQDTVFDLPTGIVALGDTLVLGDTSLTVDATRITLGDPATTGYTGYFRNWGTTTINTIGSWRMGGTLEFDSGLAQPALHGSPMVVTDGGIVRSVDTAGGLITSTFQMLDGASVDLVQGVLRLDGTTFFDGGTVSGAGTLMQNADAFVDGTVVIDPAWYVWDGLTAPTIDVGATGDLTIDARGLDDRAGLIRNRGVLDITNRDVDDNPVGWATQGLIKAHGGSSFSGTELTLDGGILELVPDNGGIGFNAPLRVQGTGQVQMSSFGAPLTLNGTTTLNGTVGTTTITGDGDLTMAGDLEVFGNVHLDCDLFDWDGIGSSSTTTVRTGASLLVELNSFSIFFGSDRMAGTIDLEPGSSLRVLKGDPEWVLSGLLSMDDATVMQSTPLRNTGRIEGAGGFLFTLLDNAGTVAPTGTIFFTDTNYEQQANGTLEIDIAGNQPGDDYGRLEASGFIGGTVTLDGALQAELTGGYVPTIGTIFEIVDADDVDGTFSTVDAPGFTVTYLSDKVLLVFVGLPPCDADLDGDGAVGFTDLTQMLGTWGPCPSCAEDIDGDGMVGFTDLTMLLGAWGSCS